MRRTSGCRSIVTGVRSGEPASADWTRSAAKRCACCVARSPIWMPSAADHQARIVHHHEHRAHPAHFVADDLAEAIFVLAIDHDGGGRAVDAELVLDRGAMDAVRVRGLAALIEAIFGDEEERDAARSPARRGAREDEVDDIVGEVMLAEGDEDLLPLDPVEAGMLAFGDLFGGRAQRADVAARGGLGQVHRAVPLAGDRASAARSGAVPRCHRPSARGSRRGSGCCRARSPCWRCRAPRSPRWRG